MGKGMRTFLVFVAPAAVMALVYPVMQSLRDARALLLLLHLATLLWVVLCFRRRPCRVSVLPLSFLLSVAAPYVMDTVNPQMFQYLGTAFVAVIYAFPWAIVTFVAAVVALVLDKKRSV